MATGLETAAGGALVKLVIERAVPSGFGLISSWINGKTLMVVGPPRSGKTTFVRYLEFGIFQHAQKTNRTYEPIDTPRFNLRLGPEKTLEVQVKTAVDVPGQYAVPLADETFNHRPHGLVIILDLSVPLLGDDEFSASAQWLTSFCDRLDYRWQNAKASKNRLRSVIVVMNKMDLVDQAVLTENEAAYRSIIAQHWKAARGPETDDVLFRPCVAVETPEGTKWVDAVLIDLATGLTR